MEVIKILDSSDLDFLKEYSAKYKKLLFQFSDKYLLSLKQELRNKYAFQVMAYEENKFCGYLASYENSLWPDYLFLGELFIPSSFQRRGIGSRLISKMICFAQNSGLQGIYTQTEFENIPAQKLYEKNGFDQIANPSWKKGVTYRRAF